MSCPIPKPPRRCLSNVDTIGAGILLSFGTNTNHEQSMDNARQFCLADTDEWIYDGTDDSNINVVGGNVLFGTVPSQIGIEPINGCSNKLFAASRVKCKRSQYTADRRLCCFQDYKFNSCGNQDSDACFVDINDTTRTCAPENRDITSTPCWQEVVNYCTGEGAAPGEWFNRWMSPLGTPQPRLYTQQNPHADPYQGVCNYAVRRALFTQDNTTGCDGVPDPQNAFCGNPLPIPIYANGYAQVQDLIKKVMQRYQKDGYRLGALPGENGYSDFQQYIYQYICCQYPGICRNFLQNVCPQYSEAQVANNSTLADWCGCYLSPAVYQNYIDNFQINRQCTPFCNRSSSLSLTDGVGNPILCDQNVCLIDNVTLSLWNAKIGGNVQFSNICGTCGSGKCSCIVQDTSISIIDSVVGGDVLIRNNCLNTNCQVKNSGVGSSTIPTPCDQSNDPLYQVQLVAADAKFWEYLTYAGISLVLLFGLILLAWFLRSKK